MSIIQSVLLITLLCLVQLTMSARILLVLPCPSPSHHIFYRNIIRALTTRGHEIVSITPEPMNDSTLANITEIDIHDIAYKSISGTKWLEDTQYKPMSEVARMRVNLPGFQEMGEGILGKPEVAQLIQNKNEHFDLVVVEMLFFATEFFAFAERFNCPAVGLLSLDAFIDSMDALGNPPHVSYYADPMMKGGRNLDFWYRLELLWYSIDFRIFYHFQFIPIANELVRKYFNSNTDVWQLQKSVDLILVNTNPLLHIPRPHVPAFIEIGGLHDRKLEGLPKDLQDFLDSSKQGVIYFSLGSNVKSENLPVHVRDSIIKAFEQLPYNILWKWESKTLTNKPKNVFIKQWLPQMDVLAHPNIKAFVTQGGLQSLEEAIRNKVPLVGIPFGGDQLFNIQRVVELGIGKELLLKDLTTDLLLQALMDVAGNPKYKNEMTKLSNLYWDQPTKPLDRAIWWIEYVIRHKGAKHLRCPAADIPWHKYLLLDIIGFILGVIILAMLAVIVLSKTVLNLLAGKSKCNKKKIL